MEVSMGVWVGVVGAWRLANESLIMRRLGSGVLAPVVPPLFDMQPHLEDPCPPCSAFRIHCF